jgi:hypothetical protein
MTQTMDDALMLILGLIPAAFALHNWEEARGFESFSRAYPRFRFAHIDVRGFRLAVTILTLAVAAGCYATLWLWPAPALIFLSKAILVALLTNAVQHAALSLAARRLVPGVISAVTMLGPLALAGLVIAARRDEDGIPEIGGYALAGALLLAAALAAGWTIARRGSRRR